MEAMVLDSPGGTRRWPIRWPASAVGAKRVEHSWRAAAAPAVMMETGTAAAVVMPFGDVGGGGRHS